VYRVIICTDSNGWSARYAQAYVAMECMTYSSLTQKSQNEQSGTNSSVRSAQTEKKNTIVDCLHWFQHIQEYARY